MKKTTSTGATSQATIKEWLLTLQNDAIRKAYLKNTPHKVQMKLASSLDDAIIKILNSKDELIH